MSACIEFVCLFVFLHVFCQQAVCERHVLCLCCGVARQTWLVFCFSVSNCFCFGCDSQVTQVLVVQLICPVMVFNLMIWCGCNAHYLCQKKKKKEKEIFLGWRATLNLLPSKQVSRSNVCLSSKFFLFIFKNHPSYESVKTERIGWSLILVLMINCSGWQPQHKQLISGYLIPEFDSKEPVW